MTEIPKQTHKKDRKSLRKNQSTSRINQESLQEELFGDSLKFANLNIIRFASVNVVQPSRNPFHDIRSTPPDPKLAVSPWRTTWQ